MLVRIAKLISLVAKTIAALVELVSENELILFLSCFQLSVVLLDANKNKTPKDSSCFVFVTGIWSVHRAVIASMLVAAKQIRQLL